MSTIPDAAVERLVDSQRVAIIERARAAKDAIGAVLADPRIKTHGMTFSQWTLLEEARRSLEAVLP